MDNPTLYVDLEVEINLKNMMDVELDIELAYNAKKNEELSEIIYEKIKSGETISLKSYHGNEINILMAGTYEVVAEIKVKREQTLYKIVKEIPTKAERFGVKIHNTLEEEDVDIVLVYSAAQKRSVYKELFVSVMPDEMIEDDLFFEGDVIQAYSAETKTLVGEFEISRSQYLYLIGDGALGSEL
jgi:3-polyprenyl-4-hydroxybenzoate decarboxylase